MAAVRCLKVIFDKLDAEKVGLSFQKADFTECVVQRDIINEENYKAHTDTP